VLGVGAYFLTRAGAGAEVGAVALDLDREGNVPWVVSAEVPHGVWLEYDLAHGGTFRLEGLLRVRAPTRVLVEDTIALGPEGPPTASGWGRVEIGGRHVLQPGGRGSSAGRVRLAEVPPQPPGTALVASATIGRPVGVLVRTLRLVVTR